MQDIIHIMKLQAEPFEAIKNGKKIIESRLYDEKRRVIKIGDIIKFQKNPDLTNSIKAQVVALLIYPTFDALMSDFPPEHFGLNSKEALLEQIHNFYSFDDENKYSVIGIRIKLL